MTIRDRPTEARRMEGEFTVRVTPHFPNRIGLLLFADWSKNPDPSGGLFGPAAKALAALFGGGPSGPGGGQDPVPAPTPEAKSYTPEYCTYLTFQPPIPNGKRARIFIVGNQLDKPGAVEIFVTPDVNWKPTDATPVPPGEPRTTFGGDGDTTVMGPGTLTVHLKTRTSTPKIRAEIEDGSSLEVDPHKSWQPPLIIK